MNIDICTPSELGESEIARWRALQDEAIELTNPFCSPSFARAVGALDPRARVAVLHEGADIVGFLPYHRTRTGIATGIARGIASCEGLVCHPDVELDTTAFLRRARVGMWEFEHLVTATTFRAARATGENTSVVDLSDGFEYWLANGTRQHKKWFNWLRRKRQRTELDLGEITFSFGDAGPDALARVIEWKSAQYRRSGWPDPFARPFVRDLVEVLAATDEVDLKGMCSATRVGETLLAVDFSLCSPDVYAGWFVTYDPAYGHFSPGTVRWLYLIEACARAGVSRVDIGAGDQEYKQRLSSASAELLSGYARRLGARAAVRRASTAPRAAVRQVIVDHPALRRGVRSSLRRVGQLRERTGSRASV